MNIIANLKKREVIYSVAALVLVGASASALIPRNNETKPVTYTERKAEVNKVGEPEPIPEPSENTTTLVPEEPVSTPEPVVVQAAPAKTTRSIDELKQLYIRENPNISSSIDMSIECIDAIALAFPEYFTPETAETSYKIFTQFYISPCGAFPMGVPKQGSEIMVDKIRRGTLGSYSNGQDYYQALSSKV